MRWLRTLLAGILALAGTAQQAQAVDEKDLLPVEEAFRLNAEAVDRTRIEFTWIIAPGYYLYRERISIKPGDAEAGFGAAVLPPGEKKHDEFFGDVEIYHGRITASISAKTPIAASMLSFKVRFQGCAEAGVCYPPQQQTVGVSLPASLAAAGDNGEPALSSPLPGGVEPALSSRVDGATTDPAAPAQGRPFGLSGDSAVAAPADKLPLPEEEAFKFEAIADGGHGFLARFYMPKGYYLYRDKTTFSIDANPKLKLAPAQWPAGVKHKDEHFGDVVVYFDTVDVPIAIAASEPLAADQRRTAKLSASFQGCEENGICYPVMQRTVAVDLPTKLDGVPTVVSIAAEAKDSAARESAAAASKPAAGAEQSDTDKLAARLASGSRLLSLFWFFVAGLGLAFTPCVFPMIPILSGIIAGAGENLTARRAFVLSLVYVLASALVFTVAGVIAGVAGANLQAALQKPAVLIAFAGLFVALALSMFGFFELQMPAALQNRINALSNEQKGGSIIGVAIMGVLSALLVGPCVAPPLAAAVVFISNTGDAVFGGAALFFLALGMGAPLVAIGSGAGSILPRAGAWMDTVKAVFGVVFLWLALWMLERVLAPATIMLGAGGLLIGSAIYLGALDRLPEYASGWHKLWKSVGVMFLLLGLIEFIGAAAGGRDWMAPLKGVAGSSVSKAESRSPAFHKIKSVADLDASLAQASAAGKPLMLDFYADWCVSCKEMEKYTFPEAGVQKHLENFVTLKADVTANDDVDQALMKRFGIIGPPGTLFFDCKKEERHGARLVGFEEADKFAQRLSKTDGC